MSQERSQTLSGTEYEAFVKWWDTQALGDPDWNRNLAYRMTAWNGWLARSLATVKTGIYATNDKRQFEAVDLSASATVDQHEEAWAKIHDLLAAGHWARAREIFDKAVSCTPSATARELTPTVMADVLREAAIYLAENMQSSLGTDCQYAADAIDRIAKRPV